MLAILNNLMGPDSLIIFLFILLSLSMADFATRLWR